MATSTLGSEKHDEILWQRRRSRALRRSPGLVFGLGILLLLGLIALLSSHLAPHDPNAQELSMRFNGPSRAHWLGTDGFGRDTLSRLIAATSVTMSAVLMAIGIAVAAGVPLGLAAGYSGRLIDSLLSRAADALLALPGLLMALAIVGALGPSLTNAMIAVGIVTAPRFFRVARAAGQSVSRQPFIEAARADGNSPLRLLWRHVLPNASGPLLVQLSFGLAHVIAAEASLSFLGLGVQPPEASWGTMIREAFNEVRRDAFPLLPPIVMVSVATIALFTLGDALRDGLGRGAAR